MRVAEIDPPAPGHPYWRRDGERLAFSEVVVALGAGELAAARAGHAQGVGEVLAASFAAADAGDPLLSRALAIAAGRLCQETVGLWSAGSEAA
jgi:hypothetical protein